ncbi:MAG: copper oxidase [Elusimicrobia bacterium]|nr:copper oxidase [Elusimicrobiota bacterium]
MENRVKVFELIVEPCKHEMAPGMVINAWCYNGQTPGPTIEAVEGDRVRILVENKLPEPTAVHWHGVLLPSGMDGVGGLSQRHIPPGDTFAYEFTLKQYGTQMYHSHGDEMVQMGLGTMGFFIIHPKKREKKIDRDYAIMLNEWFVEPGAMTPNPNVMTDFNLFTFNSRAFPGTAPLAARPGERVRLRFGHVGQDFHAIHLHGHTFKTVATDGGDIPESAQWPETTVALGPGQTRDVEFIATEGDWALHCHLRHHPMNAMGHEVPLMLGVNQEGVEDQIQSQLPGYMAMGEKGMHEHTEHAKHMKGPENTLPMMAGGGPFGPIGMGGMFTVFKVHEDIPRFATAEDYSKRVQAPEDLGWYKNPPGTVAESIYKEGKIPSKEGVGPSGKPVVYVCPMHSDVRSNKPGVCPKCGMTLEPQREKKEMHHH